MSKGKKTRKGRGLLSSMAFWSVLIVGICMLLGGIFNKVGLDAKIVSIMHYIAMVAAFIVLILLSFRGARGRGLLWFVLYVIAVVMIVGGFILGII